MRIPIVVQPRHAHLSEEDTQRLFGTHAALTPVVRLSHRGQVVYKETVTLSGKAGTMEHVRILGPFRGQTQVELSVTEAHFLGVRAPVRVSGDAAHAGWCTLEGPAGRVRIRAAIIPARHLHCDETHARTLGIRHHDVVSLFVDGRDDMVIEHVVVRVHPTFALEMHVSTDEAAAFWLSDADRVRIRPI